MPAATRINDPISCGDQMAAGSPNVFVNNIPLCRERVDATAGSCGRPPTTIQTASPNVYANGIPASRVGDPINGHPHGGNVAAGSPNVFIN